MSRQHRFEKPGYTVAFKPQGSDTGYVEITGKGRDFVLGQVQAFLTRLGIHRVQATIRRGAEPERSIWIVSRPGSGHIVDGNAMRPILGIKAENRLSRSQMTQPSQ